METPNVARLRAPAAAGCVEGLARHGVGHYGPADRKLALRIDGLLTSRAGPFAGSSLWRGSRATPLQKPFLPMGPAPVCKPLGRGGPMRRRPLVGGDGAAGPGRRWRR